MHLVRCVVSMSGISVTNRTLMMVIPLLMSKSKSKVIQKMGYISLVNKILLPWMWMIHCRAFNPGRTHQKKGNEINFQRTTECLNNTHIQNIPPLLQVLISGCSRMINKDHSILKGPHSARPANLESCYHENCRRDYNLLDHLYFSGL
jgi:hypothetical protein